MPNANTILDFSPSRCFNRKMKSLKNINYFSTDLSGNFLADYKYDITKIDCETEKFDLIICYHILEHIIEDLKDSRNFKQTRNVGDDDDQFCLRNLCCCCLQRPSIRN